jgi:flagellin-like hook-associated protein FlgL
MKLQQAEQSRLESQSFLINELSTRVARVEELVRSDRQAIRAEMNQLFTSVDQQSTAMKAIQRTIAELDEALKQLSEIRSEIGQVGQIQTHTQKRLNELSRSEAELRILETTFHEEVEELKSKISQSMILRR